jgi:hypothetical protein
MIRLGTQDDLQQIDIFDEFGGDRIISTESNNPIMLSLIKQRNYIMAGSLAKINDDGSDEVYFYQGVAK